MSGQVFKKFRKEPLKQKILKRNFVYYMTFKTKGCNLKKKLVILTFCYILEIERKFLQLSTELRLHLKPIIFGLLSKHSNQQGSEPVLLLSCCKESVPRTLVNCDTSNKNLIVKSIFSEGWRDEVVAGAMTDDTSPLQTGSIFTAEKIPNNLVPWIKCIS